MEEHFKTVDYDIEKYKTKLHHKIYYTLQRKIDRNIFNTPSGCSIFYLE